MNLPFETRSRFIPEDGVETSPARRLRTRASSCPSVPASCGPGFGSFRLTPAVSAQIMRALSYDVSAYFEPRIAVIRALVIAVCLVSCSSNPSAAHSETSERAGTATEKGSPSVEGSSVSAEPAGSSLKGAAIEAWFRQRGAVTPGTLNLEDSQCETVHAPVSSGQALSCEQHAAIKPWVRVSRRILFDARDGRTLVLVNLASRVEPFDPSSGSGRACEGALVLLRVQLSGDGKTLTVADDAGCGCEQAQKLLDKSNSGDAQALQLQAREVKQACSQRGAYVWDTHGYAPAQGE
jgi:hypothetical protein